MVDLLRRKKDVPSLLRALESEDKNSRILVIQELGKSGDERAIEPLAKALRENDEWVRIPAAIALGNFRDPQVIEPLLEAMKDSTYWMIRRAAVDSIGRIHDICDGRVAVSLVNALADKDERVIEAAAIALLQVDMSKSILEQGQDMPDSVWLQLAVNRLVLLYQQNPAGFVRGEGPVPPQEAILRIGFLIDSRGGMDLMLKAHTEFTRRCTIKGASRNLELMWDGIGQWRG